MLLKELRKRLDTHEIGVAELAEEYFSRIARLDSRYRSYLTLCPELAEKQARRAQKRIDEKNAAPLTGIPISLKDNICTAGVRTTCASKMLEDFVPSYHATVAERLFSEGAVLLGKTNMDEFAIGATGQNSRFGGSRNPYDADFVSGGSSAGAAVGVAAGLCAAAFGSDTGGSVRLPSAFCGVVGFKPTYGRVSRYGLIAFSSSMEQIGPIARSSEDCAVLMNAVAGRDRNDATSCAVGAEDFAAKIGASFQGLTIGIPKELFGKDITEEVRESVLAAAEYYRLAGCRIRSVSLPSIVYAVAAYYLLSSAEAASNLARMDGIRYGHRAEGTESFFEQIAKSRGEGFGKEVKRRILLGNYALSAHDYDAYYRKAQAVRSRLRAEFSEVFETCDLLLAPTAPTPAYPIDSIRKSPAEVYAADVCTVPASLAGLPSVSTPCGYTDAGLPIGMSLIGRAFDDALVLMAADRFEREFTRKEPSL